MKQISIIAALVLGLMTGCSSNKKEAQEEAKRMFQIESVDENSGLQRMQVSRINQEIACKGKKFRLSVERVPDGNLPHVKSDMGLFMDNSIQVKITRENGTTLFEKKFTKNDFAVYLPKKYLNRSVLEGLVFDDVRTTENKELTLAASVSYPMTDLYIPFVLVVSQDGKLTISKDEDMGEMTFLENNEE
ncbi:MAG: DUF4738 domain-containing protein [Bacteroides sp.]|nr:DUF4738 domain-containing protein [Bacteroides sp.]